MKHRFLAAAVLALAQGAAAQSVPAANYTDMWWNPAESGWGVSFTQHVATNQAYAVWYTYDPREPDNTTLADAGDFKPLWIVMSGGQWLTPTQMRGEVFVANGTPFFQSGSSTALQSVGMFTFTFNDVNHATFQYDIVPPAGLASTNPAFGLPAFSGAKAITRQSF